MVHGQKNYGGYTKITGKVEQNNYWHDLRLKKQVLCKNLTLGEVSFISANNISVFSFSLVILCKNFKELIMKEKIFQALKLAYVNLGLSDEILQGQADALGGYRLSN